MYCLGLVALQLTRIPTGGTKVDHLWTTPWRKTGLRVQRPSRLGPSQLKIAQTLSRLMVKTKI